MTEPWREDGWRDTKERPEEPDEYYERAVLGGPEGMVVGHLALKWRRLPDPVIAEIQRHGTAAEQKSAAEWMTMPYFDAHARCAKCGHREAATAWEAAREGLFAGHDVLHRSCRRCGYSWHERPLDSER